MQIADGKGQVTFETIVPGCYPGRWTHIHFEVYENEAAATTGSNAVAISQLAFPQDMLDTVYALGTYPGSARNLSQIGGIENDNVFGDGYELQMGMFAGDAASGYVGSFAVGVDMTTEATLSQAPGGGGGGGGAGGPRP
ncbi:MAG: hypothetical protein ACTHNQ_15630 [Microbacterium sp.]|uniref:hypothetical protein n=1 Tax=Microbacterium sp. TaxID=51671 RepID=UPI003F7E9A50